MKSILQDTAQSDNIQNELDKAIDEMNIEQIEESLNKLSVLNPLPSQTEDSKLFAKRIINQNKKGFFTMKNNYKKIGALTASALLIITIGTTAAYATGLLNKITFFNKDTTVVVKSNQSLSDQEAKKLADEAASSYGKPVDEKATVTEPVRKDFSSLAEAEKAFDTKIVIPSYIPEDFKMDQTIHTETVDSQNTNLYATYTSSKDSKRLFGITVIKETLGEDSTSVLVTDSVYKDKYTTPSGTKYTLFDEDGGILAKAEVNDIEYVLAFMGVSQEEIYKIIDSADLTAYVK